MRAEALLSAFCATELGKVLPWWSFTEEGKRTYQKK